MFNLLEKFKFNYAESHNIDFRYPTRDIFLANLSCLQNCSELVVLVNHWPSRTGGGRFETEPLRVAVAENCARAVEKILKIPWDNLVQLPDSIKDNEITITQLNQKWNKNILIMGGFK